mgnify:CR=1 FL=1
MSVQHRIAPCLWFADQAEEAANLYVDIFPDSRIVEIVRYAQEQEIDMIVITTHGRTGLAHVLLGSIATGKYVDLLEPVFGERNVLTAVASASGDGGRSAARRSMPGRDCRTWASARASAMGGAR